VNAGSGRDALRGQYRLSVEEYRFQVDLNWRRSEYFFVLNIGVLVAGATLLASQDVPRALVALVFVLGALLAFLSFLANDTQSGYYHAARDLKKKLEKDLELEDSAIATTPGMGSGIARLGRVGTFLKTMLVAIACVDLVGASLSVADAVDTDSNATGSQVAVRVIGQSPAYAGPIFVVVSRDNKVLATRSGSAGKAMRPISLDPGRYQVSVAGSELCSKPLNVSSTPLQLARVACGAGP
jgi:hypothetical protein